MAYHVIDFSGRIATLLIDSCYRQSLYSTDKPSGPPSPYTWAKITRSMFDIPFLPSVAAAPIYSFRFQPLLFVDRRLGKRRFCNAVLPPALCASQTNRLHSERRGPQNLQVQGRKSSRVGDVYTRHNSAKSSWQMEMPARDQQGCGQSILSLGLTVWRDQLDDVVALVGTFDGFVGLSLFKRNLNKQRPYQKKTQLQKDITVFLSVFVFDTNNHMVDTNYQILQITVWLCSKQENLTKQRIDLVAIDSKQLSCKKFHLTGFG